MAHCKEFFEKWKRDGNFCGVGEVQGTIIRAYLDFVHELSQNYGINEESCYKLLTSSAIAGNGFLLLSKESPRRKEVVEKIVDFLKRDQKVRRLDIRKWTAIAVWDNDFIETNCIASAKGTMKSNKVRTARSIQSAKIKAQNESWTASGQLVDQPIEARIKNLQKVSTRGQINILEKIVSKGYAKDIYSAYCLVLTWAANNIETLPQRTSETLEVPAHV